MPILLQDPCDNLTSAPWATTAGTPTIDPSGKTGNGISINTTTSIAYNIGASSQTDYVTIGCWIKFSAIPGTQAPFMRWRGDAGVTTHVTLQIYTTHASFVRFSGGVVLGLTTLHGMTTGNWYYVEASVKLSDTVGQCIFRINGTPIITTSSNEDTKSGGTATVFDQVGLVGGTGLSFVVDDVYIRNDNVFGVGTVSSSVTDLYKTGKSSSLSVADLERVDYTGAANRSVTDLAAGAVGKVATQSMADRYWLKMFAGYNRSLSDKSLINTSKVKAYSDTMFVAGA